MKKFIKANLYSAADIAAAATIILFVLYIMKKTSIKPFAIIIMITSLLFGFQALFGQTKVENQSDSNITAKPENGTEPAMVAKGSEMYDIDGVKTDGKVFKAVDGTHIVVGKDGTVSTKSLVGKFINRVRGGYLSTSPDSTWDKLFNS